MKAAQRSRAPKAVSLDQVIKTIVDKTILAGKLDAHKVREKLRNLGVLEELKQLTPKQIEEKMNALYGYLGGIYWWTPRERLIVRNVKNLLVNISMEGKTNPYEAGSSFVPRQVQTEFGKFKPDSEPIVL
ncbi:MAG: hypothetical protein QXH27_02630 [Candidatus Micrarchaeia archaeon]